jgi:hypothetical protein
VPQQISNQVSFEDACDIYQYLKDHAVPNKYPINALLVSAKKTSKESDVLFLITDAITFKVSDANTLNSLLNISIQQKQLEQTIIILETMFRHGVVRNSFILI